MEDFHNDGKSQQVICIYAKSIERILHYTYVPGLLQGLVCGFHVAMDIECSSAA